MISIDGYSKKAKDDCLILVLEDGQLIANSIVKLFQEKWKCNAEIAECMEKAMRFVNDKNRIYNLGIIDVMIPSKEDELEEIHSLEEKLEKVNNTIRDIMHNDRTESISSARSERSYILKKIDTLIDKEGGIKFVQLLRGMEKNINHKIPILYLAALGNDEIIQKGKVIAGDNSAWLTKPASGETILEKCEELLSINK